MPSFIIAFVVVLFAAVLIGLAIHLAPEDVIEVASRFNLCNLLGSKSMTADCLRKVRNK